MSLANPLRVLDAAPVLAVADVRRAVAFYAEALGFSVVTTAGDPPVFAIVARDGVELMLRASPAPAPGGGWSVYLRVGDVAAEAAAITAAGHPLAAGPTDRAYAMREIEVRDPDGHVVCLAEDTTWEAAARETWEGVLDVGAARLRLALHLDVLPDGRARATLDSPDQQALGIPVERCAREADALVVELPRLRASWRGAIAADGASATGPWEQGGRSWPLTLRRALP